VDKPNARLFAATILVFGLIERTCYRKGPKEGRGPKSKGHTILPCYAVSDSAADTIVDIAATVGASYLILGAPQRSMIINLLRGNIIRNISSILLEEIHLLVHA